MEEQKTITGKNIKLRGSTVTRVRNNLLIGLSRINLSVNDAIEVLLKDKNIIIDKNKFITSNECREIAREEAESVIDNLKRNYN